ncbi:MAG: hypothetical protein CTY29_02170 [Methylobacter sp.]|nr:MAG: hypothetical protein CTY29_02170 [Methylobacter sp.]PPD21492.1 MAG: hypothetical protein CTY24_07715 [Methylobacter sp.]
MWQPDDPAPGEILPDSLPDIVQVDDVAHAGLFAKLNNTGVAKPAAVKRLRDLSTPCVVELSSSPFPIGLGFCLFIYSPRH